MGVVIIPQITKLVDVHFASDWQEPPTFAEKNVAILVINRVLSNSFTLKGIGN